MKWQKFLGAHECPVQNLKFFPTQTSTISHTIPPLQLFNADGETLGQSIGVRQPQELEALAKALEGSGPLPQLAGVGAISSLEPVEESRRDVSSSIGPRSHG